MTVGLQITDGTTTVDLNDGSYWEITELDIGEGDVSAQTVSGSVRLYMDSTKANMQAEIAALQKLLQQAVEYSGTSLGAPLYSSLDQSVYLNYRTDSTEAYYRSQIYRASWSMPPESIKTLNDSCRGIEYIVDFERWNWFEGEEAQLPLTNPTATNTTNAITVYNPFVSYSKNTISFTQATKKISDSASGLAGFKTGDTIWVYGSSSNDGRYTVATGGVAAEIVVNEALVNEGASATVYLSGSVCDFVTIASSDVTGDLPAAIRLEMTNIYNPSYSAAKLQEVWIGQNFTNPLTFDNILESSTPPNVGQTTNVGSGAETTIMTWTLDDAFMSAAAGRYYKALAMLKTGDVLAVGAYYRLKLMYGSVTVWQSSQVKSDQYNGVVDLLTFQLPPLLAGLSSLSSLSLLLTVQHSAGVTLPFIVDHIHLLPVDGFMYDVSVLGNVALNQRIVNDGFSRTCYMDNGSGADKVPMMSSYGMPITLQPGRTQRLYFSMDTNLAMTSDDAQNIAVKIYYRPRRLSI